ncbi:MAG: Serine/threonine-protein kinase pkn3 [Labilithrix sp.]|nr:Serine/threonine-protein kinase pkn3 [Labilithrix sp.]
MREQSPVVPGDLVDGKYRIQTILGIGGMGVVVRAMHEQLGRSVAMKFLLPEMLRSTDIVQRFEREARATARLQNEHVIDVIDVGRLPSGEPFIVMEYLEGQDLAKLIAERAGTLGIDEIVDIMSQICVGVSEAHANGIVHRDLKPQNVFVITRRDGRRHIKVLDFGISKIAGDVGGALTRTSDVLGSPYYMSPEQLLATRDVGPSGDVWALGVILYEMLTGAVPFRGETLAQMMMRIIQSPHVPIPEARGDVPQWLAGLVDRCLQKDPAQRMPSVDALASALLARGAGPAPPQPSLPHSSTALMPHSAQTALHPSSGQVPNAAPAATMLHSSPSMPGHSAQLPQGASTNVGWGHSSQPGMTQIPTRGGKPIVVLGAVVAVVLLSVGGFGLHHFMKARAGETVATKPVNAPPPPPATSSASIETATSTTTTTAEATPPASVAPSATPAPATTASGTRPTVSMGATAATTKPPTSGTSRPAATTAKPHGAEPDFLPSLRK